MNNPVTPVVLLLNDTRIIWLGVFSLAFNATFRNISVISWRSVLLVEETEYPQKTTDLSQVTSTLNAIKKPNQAR
jgi:hypothetical protein